MVGFGPQAPFGGDLAPPAGIAILAASSDHLVIDSGNDRAPLIVGSEVSFQLNYSALLRAMTSPFISKAMNSKALSGLAPGAPIDSSFPVETSL